jgi:hypothetical protein
MASHGSRIAMDETSANLVGNNTRHATPEKIGRYRWKICSLLFFATTLNYMDRQVLALLKPTLQDPIGDIGLTEVQFAAIVSIRVPDLSCRWKS